MKFHSHFSRGIGIRGFSLLELMITLVVLSVGLLGLGLMQTAGLGLTKGAHSRTEAMLLAGDMADRIRANSAAEPSYLGVAVPSSPSCNTGAACTGAAIAASDRADWANRIQAEFPNGKGEILDATSTAKACPQYTATAVPAGFARILITWAEVNGGANLSGGEANGDCYEFDFVHVLF